MNGRFLVNRSEGKIMGVAAGLADYTGVDPLLIRLAFVAAFFVAAPLAIIFYLVTGLVAADH